MEKAFYVLSLEESPKYDLVRLAISEDKEEDFSESDQNGLIRVVDRRRRDSERYFDEVAERLGKHYAPCSSWESIGHLLIRLVPPIVVADLGAGEGMISHLIAEKAKKVFYRQPKSMVRLGGISQKK